MANKKKKGEGADYGGYTLENAVKLDRVIKGEVTREGRLSDGLGEGADPADVIAHYDKLGGLITKDGRKVKTGSFWDFEHNRPHKEPDVIFEHRTGSGELFTYRGEVEPLEVAAEKATRARKSKADKNKEEEEDEE